MSPPFWIGLAGSIAVEAGLIFYAWRTGIFLFPSIGIVLIPLLILFQTGISWLLNWFVATLWRDQRGISVTGAWLHPIWIHLWSPVLEGPDDNSPTLQRWEPPPNVETLGYSQKSLRDRGNPSDSGVAKAS